jgi:hypothetical protein
MDGGTEGGVEMVAGDEQQLRRRKRRENLKWWSGLGEEGEKYIC